MAELYATLGCLRTARASAMRDVGLRVRDRHLGVGAHVCVSVDVAAMMTPLAQFSQFAGDALARLERMTVAHASEERRRIALVRVGQGFDRSSVFFFLLKKPIPVADSIVVPAH
jgi:hypothetical protein